MHDLVYLRDLVIILAFGVIIVAIFHRLKLPSIAGFILSGIIVGPQGLGLIGDIHQVELLAEIGVALLLFGIGLELSLEKIKRLWKLILTGGLLQVGLSIVATVLIARFAGVEFHSAVFIGFLIALSSTAIVMRGLDQRGEIDTPHGRLTLGILVFQDFSVVPMMLVIPMLTGSDVSAGTLITTMLKAIGLIVAVLLAAVYVVPRILDVVAKTRQRQLFILCVFLICIGTAWLLTSAGVSLAIGAFLAGLIVAGSEYRHQAMADMISFREVFASIFFVSMGMLLMPSIILDNMLLVMAILAAAIFGKALITFISSMIIRMPLRVGLLAAIALAQIGEFSFVLMFSVQGTGLIDPALENSLISAAIVSMFITPFALSLGPNLAAGIGKLSSMRRLLDVNTVEEAASKTDRMKDHIIIGGYGFAGRQLCRALRKHDIPHIVVDINIENVREAMREGVNALFGDVTNQHVLEKLGVERAAELVLLVNDSGAAEQAARAARKLAPPLHIVVRTHYMLDLELLMKAGADDVVPSEREAAVEITAQVLKRHKIGTDEIIDRCRQIRSEIED